MSTHSGSSSSSSSQSAASPPLTSGEPLVEWPKQVGLDSPEDGDTGDFLERIRKLQLPPRPSLDVDTVQQRRADAHEENTARIVAQPPGSASSSLSASENIIPVDAPPPVVRSSASSVPAVPRVVAPAIRSLGSSSDSTTSQPFDPPRVPACEIEAKLAISSSSGSSDLTHTTCGERVTAAMTTAAPDLPGDASAFPVATPHSQQVGGPSAAAPAIPTPPPVPPPATPFATALQQLQQQYRTQLPVDMFIDPTDPQYVATSLQTPGHHHERREPHQPLQGTTGAGSTMRRRQQEEQGRPADERVEKLRRAKSPWEKTKGVPLFAASSSSSSSGGGDDGDDSDDSRAAISDAGGSWSDGSRQGSDHGAFRAIGRKRPQPTPRQPPSQTGLVYDELDEVSPAEAAAQREAEQKARAKQQRRIAKEAAKRVVMKNLENTVTSATSESQQGVSLSSASAGQTPQTLHKQDAQQDRLGEGKQRTGRRLRFADAGGHGTTTGGEDAEAGPAPADAPQQADGAASLALVPYAPTLRGPVSALKRIYAADTRRPEKPLSLFSWRPPFAAASPPLGSDAASSSPPSSSLGPAPPSLPFSGSLASGAAAGSSTLHTALAVTIRGMSPLHADVGVVHPFVRVWFVHCVTGESLIDSGPAVPCAITHPYDLRTHGSRSPWWEAEISLRVRTDLVRKHLKAGVLLFEVLDCGNESIYGFYMPRTGLYPICWGFLMLHDCFGHPATLFAENVHVQMYRYPLRTPWYVQWLQSLLPPWCSSSAIYAPTEFCLDETGVLRTVTDSEGAAKDAEETALLLASHAPPAATAPAASARGSPPAVFLFFKSPLYRGLAYDGGLVVTVRAPRAELYVPRPTHMLPYEEYLLNLLVTGGGSCAVPRRGSASSSTGEGASGEDSGMIDPLVGGRYARMRAMMRSISLVNQQALGQEYARKEGERALLPTTSLQAAPVHGVVTCMSFFHVTPILAMGLTRDLQYVVELRNTMQPDLPVLARLLGLTDHVHSLAVQKDDRFVLACSADKTVRVWRVTDLSQTILATLEGALHASNTPQLVVEPMCVLPHAHPVYSAVFHQDIIITAGYSEQLRVWRYDRLLMPEHRRPAHFTSEATLSPGETSFPSSLSREVTSTMQLTATFTPGLDRTHPSLGAAAANNAGDSDLSRQQLGELICTTDTEGDGIVLCVASNERSARVWSVTSGGTVFCWRALYEVVSKGKRREGGGGGGADEAIWQMSVRHRSDAAGASRVEVAGTYAIVTCRASPIVYVFDATTCESVRVVNTRMAANTIVRLLPDGEAFVAGTVEGTLAAWDCADGSLCTPSHGDYNVVKTKFPIADIAWADGQQLAALQSPAPCPESFLPTYGVPPPLSLAPGFADGGTALANAQQSAVPTEVTMVAIVGAARSTCRPIAASDKHAREDFCARCGGDVGMQQRAAQQAARARALRRQQAEYDARKTRLYSDSKPSSLAMTTTSVLPELPVAFGFGEGGNPMDAGGLTAPVSSPALEYSDAGMKINSILNFWRGLVGQHRHTPSADVGTLTDRRNGHRGARGEPEALAQRAGHYAAGAVESDHGGSDDDDDSGTMHARR